MESVALVVGAGQGMGRAIAIDLAARGAHVHLAGRTRGKLADVATRIQDAGGSATVHALDAGRESAVRDLVAAVGERLDVVVHTVGESLMATLDDTTEAQWQQMVEVNLSSAFHIARHTLPALRRSANPTLLLVVSKVAVAGYPVVAYSAVKTGVLGLARSLASELEPQRIRVVALCPGPTDTPMRWAATPDMDRDLVIDPESVAAAARFVTELPRGTTVEPLVVQAIGYH